MLVGGFVLLVCFAQCGSTPTTTITTVPVAVPPRTVYVTVPVAPTATTPPPVPTDDPAPVDVDVHPGGHVNLPDGALTGGYCRHKWWC